MLGDKMPNSLAVANWRKKKLFVVAYSISERDGNERQHGGEIMNSKYTGTWLYIYAHT